MTDKLFERLIRTSHTLDSSTVCSQLSVSPSSGHSLESVQRLRKQHGPNEIEEPDDEPLWWQYIEQFTDPLVLLLLASAIISLFLQQYDDAISIFLAVVIVSTVAFVQEYKSEQAVDALKSYVQHQTTVIRNNGTYMPIPIEELVPGDIVSLKIGDRVPADLRIIQSSGLRASEAILTGENRSRSKFSDALPAEPDLKYSHLDQAEQIDDDDDDLKGILADFVTDRKNMLFMGTEIAAGTGLGIVIGTGKNTQFAKIAQAIAESKKKPTPLQESMTELGKQLSIISFGIIAIIFAIGFWQGHPWMDMFNVSISLAVAAIPEGLPIVVTVTLALGVSRMAKKKAIIRRLPAVEALGATSVCCVDKTGTLTCNAMTVTRVWTPGETSLGSTFHISGAGYSGTGSFSIGGSQPVSNPTSNSQLNLLARIGTLCNDAQFESNGRDEDSFKLIGQPTEGSLLALGLKLGLSLNYRQQPENNISVKFPFNSAEKWMAVKSTRQNSTSSRWFVKGSLEWVISHSGSILTPSGVQKMTDRHRESAFSAGTLLASSALRVLALAYADCNDLKVPEEGTVFDSESTQTGTVAGDALVFVGIVGILDPPRPTVLPCIKQALDGKIQICMITGDSKETACAIASELQFFNPAFDTAMSSEEVQSHYKAGSLHTLPLEKVKVFYRSSPFDKKAIVEAFQKRGHVVAMTGDGVNDALSLKMADVGIAMGNASDVTKEVSEMILVNNDFASILAAIEEGKCIFNNIGNFLSFQLATSIAALTIMTLSTLFAFPLPLSTSMILFINIIMDGFPAQSLGIEPVEKSIMKKPPRDRKQSVLTPRLLLRVFLNASIMVFGTLFLFNQQLTHYGAIHPTSNPSQGEIGSIHDVGVADDKHALSVAFATFVMFQMFNALNCRNHTKSILALGIFKNRALVYSLAGSIIGMVLIIYLPQLQFIFSTTELSISDWVSVLSVSSTVLIFAETCKAFGIFTGP